MEWPVYGDLPERAIQGFCVIGTMFFGGFDEAFGFQQHHRPVIIGLRVIRFKRNGFIKTFNGFVPALQHMQRMAKIIAYVRLIGFYLQRRLKQPRRFFIIYTLYIERPQPA